MFTIVPNAIMFCKVGVSETLILKQLTALCTLFTVLGILHDLHHRDYMITYTNNSLIYQARTKRAVTADGNVSEATVFSTFAVRDISSNSGVVRLLINHVFFRARILK